MDFRNTIIVMTSNLGSDHIQSAEADTDYDSLKSMVMEVVSRHFRPEFINRIDDLVVFHRLDKAELLEIAGIQLEILRERLQQRDLNIVVSDKALQNLVDYGFDPVFGARPLRRVIQTKLENLLAEEILHGRFTAGDTIYVDLDASEQIVFADAASSHSAVA